MAPDTGALTSILAQFLDVFRVGIGAVQIDARILLRIISLIEICLIGLWWGLGAGEDAARLFRRVLTISFFIWVVDDYPEILRWVIGGFAHAGRTASGSGFGSIEDPSAIIDLGYEACFPALVLARDSVGFSVSGIVDALLTVFCLLVILLSYFILAIQVFVTRIEFGLVSTLGLILIPFGVFKPTAFLAERVFGAIVAFGVKLMVLSFVIGVGIPILSLFALPEDPSWIEMFNMMVPALSILVLSLHAPGVATGLLSGVPNLTASNGGAVTAAAGASAIRGVKAGAEGINRLRGRR